MRKNCVSGIVICFLAGPLWAEPVSLLSGADMSARRAPLVSAPPTPLVPAMIGVPRESQVGPSLFAGRASGGFFEPVAPRPPKRLSQTAARRMGTTAPSYVQAVRAVIGRAESAGAGYDAVQHGANRPPHKPPSQMTLGEIFAWIEATPGQPHAIGYYQFIPNTLARLVTLLDLGPEVVFTPEVQDRLADILLVEAGLYEVRHGQMTRHAFMGNLAKIWAGLPTKSGKSHYHGYAGNKATVSWAEFDRALAQVFPG